MGIAGTSFGLTAGFIIFTLPQILVAQQVPESTIASVTAAALSPGFFSFLISPILDVRFSRRWYATVLTVVAAVFIGMSVPNARHILALTIAVTAAWTAMVLATNALCGWLSTVSRKEDENQLSAWLTVTNFGGSGIMAVAGGELVRHVSLPMTGVLLCGMILLPMALDPSGGARPAAGRTELPCVLRSSFRSTKAA